MARESLEELQANRLRQRFWGATVLIAIAVIVLPFVLDGSGSESQFRRVESLREEPPRVIDIDGNTEVVAVPAMKAQGGGSETPGGDEAIGEIRIHIGEADPPDYLNTDETDPAGNNLRGNEVIALTAWVVQAGSFSERDNAYAVRDKLRRQGYPTFVSEVDANNALYRVRVGPMIDRARANSIRDEVVTLLGREAIVKSYP
ncbi:MAG: SPOR domain-containing protein [Granulosicoccus sp.]